MDFSSKNISIFTLLLGGIAHIMLFQDGYWNNYMWITAAMCIIMPLFLYKIFNNSKRIKEKRRKAVADI